MSTIKIIDDMKKYLILLILCILCSCNSTPILKTDTGTVIAVESYQTLEYSYKVTVSYRYKANVYGQYDKSYFQFYTNTLYKVGDTIRIHY